MSISDTSLNESFLAGGGQTGVLLRNRDWNAHPLGHPSQWPQSLKTTVGIVLRSSYPMFVWWGKEGLINIYNDAYIPIMGKKHPHFLAKSGFEAWGEIWEDLSPFINLVFEKGEATYANDLRLIMQRHGFAEETYFNFSYSPIIGEQGTVDGLFCACHEETQKVLQHRRLQNLTTLSGKLAHAQNLTDIAGLAMEKLAENANDIPYAGLYLINERGQALLAASYGIPKEAHETVFPLDFFYTDDQNCPIREVIRSGKPLRFAGMQQAISVVPNFFAQEAPKEIYIQPINDGSGRPAAVLITAVTPLCPFTDDFRNYLQTIANKISTAIRTVNTLRIEQEARQKTEDSRRRFHEMIMEAPMGIAVLRGPEFVVEIANDSYLELVDRPRKKLEGHGLFDAIPELRGQAVEPLLNGVLHSGEPIHGNEFEALLVRDGKKESRYFNFVYKPMRDNGEITGILVVAIDVTDMVKSKHAIQESETRFRTMVMHSPIPMTIFRGEDYIVEMANLQMLQNIWQREEHEVIGKKALEAFPELMDQKYPELLRHVLATGIPHRENEAEAYVGSLRFYLDFEYGPLFETDGTVSGIMITVNDVTERVESRQRLEESETHFRRMADGVPMMIWITQNDGKCTYVNKQWHDYTGQKGDESLVYGWLDGIHPDDRPRVYDDFQVSLSNQEGFATEFRLKNTQDQYRWMIAVGLPRFGSNGQFDGYIGTVADIDDRKKAEEQLRESEERSRLAILAAELGTYEWEMSTGRVLGSERFMNIFGYTGEDEVQRDELMARIHPEDRPIHKAAHEEALRTGTLSYETRLIWTDQSIHWIKLKGKIVQDRNRNNQKMLGTVMDITDIRRFEQALKTSESRLSEAQRIAGIGNWEYYYTDKSFYCSDEVYRILGTTPDLFVPHFQNLFRIIHPQDIKKLNRTLSFTRKTGLPFNIDFRILAPEEKYINSQGYVVLDAQQKIVKIIGTLQDITLRKRVEEELIEAKSISEKSLRYKDQFLANMSHEIRTPMNAIVGFTELLLKTRLQNDQQQYIDAIKVSGENLLVIINDILDFSKLEAGAIHFEQIPFRLSEVVSTLTDLMLPKSVEKGIKLSVTIDPHISDHLVGDPTRLNQILLNLVGNAIKFTERGEVKIAVGPRWEEAGNTELQFTVTDTGIGIDPTMLDAIFDVFTQTTSDTTRKYGGSGLGLAIVKQFVEKQNGNVGVESTPGKGSTFWFTLPFGKSTQEDMVPKPRVSEEQIHESTTGLRILLVEDNKLNQLLASKALSDWNCEVEVADNGLIALEKVAQKDFDLILMDIQLPEMDGYEATRHIRQQLPAPKCHIPIIAVTAHAMHSEAKKCSEAGMNGYISKPFSPKMLYEGIMAVMKPADHTVTKTEKIN